MLDTRQLCVGATDVRIYGELLYTQCQKIQVGFII